MVLFVNVYNTVQFEQLRQFVSKFQFNFPVVNFDNEI